MVENGAGRPGERASQHLRDCHRPDGAARDHAIDVTTAHPPRGHRARPLMPGNDLLNRRLSVPGEAAIVAAVLLAWQAIRVPIEGGSTQSLSHARGWERLHHRLGLSGLQDRVIDVVHHHGVLDVARWSYSNIHVFSIFAFMVAVRAAAPSATPPCAARSSCCMSRRSSRSPPTRWARRTGYRTRRSGPGTTRC
jgi:hypothetical protein